VLSDHEQRALDELERRYAIETREPDRDRAAPQQPSGWTAFPGARTLVALGGLSVLLLLVGVAAAALALATASAVGWLSWRLWTRRRDGGSITASPVRQDRTLRGAGERRSGASIRDYLRWLAEAE
jgi:hypothetical protein